MIAFTDWSAIRASTGSQELTGASPFLDKALALRNESTPGGFGLDQLQTHAATWGFDVFDLDWEIEAETEEGLLWVLRLRAGFAEAGVVAKLDAYHFHTEALPFGILRTTRDDDLTRMGVFSPNRAFLNTGIAGDGITLVLSENGSLVRSLLASGPRDVADLSMRAVAAAMAKSEVAVVMAGDRCQDVRELIARLSPEASIVVAAELAKAGRLEAYDALGMGYDWDADATGRVALGYADEGAAQRDLSARSELASGGYSLKLPGPARYADEFFELARSFVLDRTVILDLAQVAASAPSPVPSGFTATNLFARRLIATIWLQRDMLLAACGP